MDFVITLVVAALTLIINKAVFEPIAAAIGRRLVDRYLEEVCEMLDMTVDLFGIDIDAEKVVRDYLKLDSPLLSEREIEKIVEATFAAWDLRMVAHGL